MVNLELVKYIETVSGQGFPESNIHEVLIKNGWQSSDIEEAFSHIKMMKSDMASKAPMAPGAIHPTANTESLKPVLSQKKDVEYNSPFSIGLTVLLFISLMILINKFINDFEQYTKTINSELIFDALIILPFLFTAFILHEIFVGTGKRYLILSQTYFVVSAFLLVRLLWDTSKYILNANASYGVYIVLVMIILVLTGSVLFVQKYIKE